jgi:hypothetical protein
MMKPIRIAGLPMGYYVFANPLCWPGRHVLCRSWLQGKRCGPEASLRMHFCRRTKRYTEPKEQPAVPVLNSTIVGSFEASLSLVP